MRLAGKLTVVAMWVIATSVWHGSSGREPSTNQLGDDQVTDAIEMEFWVDSAIDANDIDLSTQQEVVTFTGTVDSILAKERAEAIAASTGGVRSVINRIRVEHAVDPTDAELQDASWQHPFPPPL